MRVVFVSNSSAPTIAEHTAALAAIGIVADGDVISSSTAAAELIDAWRARSGVLVVLASSRRFSPRVRRRSAAMTKRPLPLAWMWSSPGLHRTFDYERLRLATAAIRGGARFVATNRDPLFPTPAGPIPGGGSIVASIATATGVEPETAGKPHQPMVRAVHRLLGDQADPATPRRHR